VRFLFPVWSDLTLIANFTLQVRISEFVRGRNGFEITECARVAMSGAGSKFFTKMTKNSQKPFLKHNHQKFDRNH